MAIEWEAEDEKHVGLMFELAMLKTDDDKPMQIRHGQAILKVMDDILEKLVEQAEGNKDDLQAAQRGTEYPPPLPVPPV